MKRNHATFVASRIALAVAGLLLSGTSQASAETDARDQGLAILDQPSSLQPDQAAALLAAQTAGQTLPVSLALELSRFARDNLGKPKDDQQAAAQAGFVDTLTRALLIGSRGQPDASRFGITAFSPSSTLQQVYDTVGIATTLGWLTASYLAPDLAPFVLPHNARTIGTSTASQTASVTTGQVFTPLVTTNVTVGQNFTVTTTLDIDALVLTAIDQALVSDTLLVQAPLSTSVAIRATCTAITGAILGRRCLTFSLSTSTFSNDRVFATNPSYRFAYPINAGEFPTRVTASDALQLAYDALGTLNTQAPRDPIARSPFANIPALAFLAPGTGLADLSTQAPAVNFFGIQTTSDAALNIGLVDHLLSPALSALGLGTVDLRLHQPVPPLTTPIAALTIPHQRLGFTAGYRASEVRAGHPNLIVVRWHNLGTSTVTGTLDNALSGAAALPTPLAMALASAPATFYYDVPAGEYTLSNARQDAQGGVYVVDYPVAAQAPAIVLPPTLPNLAGLPDLLQGLLGALVPAGGNAP